jgi:hypothetical protein
LRALCPGPAFLILNALVNFFTMHSDITGRFDPEPNLAAPAFQYSHGNVIADLERFAVASGRRPP